MESSFALPLITAAILGFLIGLQRSIANQLKNEPVILGDRTFALISILGFLSYKIDPNSTSLLLATALLLLATYIAKVLKIGKLGVTTQFSALITFLLGVLCAMDKTHLATFTAVLVILFLEIKPKLKKLEQSISSTDINAVVLLLVMSFVILPLLPDRFIDPLQLFNPYKTWLMAILIASISFVGYIAIKLFGHRYGLFLTGAAGGLISSTAVTISLATLYKKERSILHSALAGIAIAWTFMFLRVLIEAALIDLDLAKRLMIPYIVAASIGAVFSYLFFKKADPKMAIENETLSKNPLQLSEAIKFALLFGVIYGSIKLVEAKFGQTGVYVISFLSGLTDVDAITLSLSQMSKTKEIMLTTALYGIVIASLTNTFVKLLIAFYLGSVQLGARLMKLFVLIMAGTIGGLYLARSLSITFG